MSSSPVPMGDDPEMVIFEAALAIPAPERAAWLETACGGSAELLQRVSERLLWEERMGGFLLSPFAPPADEDSPFRPGDVAANRFEIVREIARGGMAIVYEALDRKTHQTVALKCPKPQFRRRLLSELQSALRVTHPNICRLYEIHSASTNDGEIDFLTMEFLEGETLAQRLERSPLKPEEKLLIIHQLCAGLGEAHSHNIVHGDLKPGNVILTSSPDGALRAVITDFGLARNFGPSTDGGPVGASLRGTPDYVAPELWRGEAASPAADIFAMGVILYELLTGELPGAKSTLDKVELPKRWRRMVQSCLADDPARRPSRAGMVDAAFRPARSLAPVWAAAGIILAALTLGLWSQWRAPAVPDVVRLAILPAQTDSPTAVVGNGASYDLSDRLAGPYNSTKQVLVVPLADAERFHISGVDLSKSGLGVTHALLMRWTSAGDSYDVSGELYDAAINRRILSFHERYRPAALGALPALVSAKLSSAFHRTVSIGAGEIPHAAYRDYVEALHYLRGAHDPGRARTYFEKVRPQSGGSLLVDLRLAEAGILDYTATHSETALARASLILDRAKLPGPSADAKADLTTALLVASLNAARGPSQAVAIYRDAVGVWPQSGEMWRNLAEALRTGNHSPKEATAAYRKAIALEPGYYEPWRNFGVFSFYRGLYQDARDQFARASALAPGLPVLHVDLADALLVLGDFVRAEQEYRQALNIQRDPVTLMDIGALLAYQQRHTDSVYYYEQAASMSPEDIMTLSNLADSYRRTGRAVEAKEAYRRVIEAVSRHLAANPRSTVDSAFKAYALARLGKRAMAVAEIQSAIRMAPENVLVRRTAVVTFQALHMRREALDQIRAAPILISELSRQPDLADFRQDPRFQEMSRQDQLRKAEPTK